MKSGIRGYPALDADRVREPALLARRSSAIIATPLIDVTTGGAVLIALYLVPAIIALVRDHHRKRSIIAIDVLLGWTMIGWIVALVIACRPRHPGPANAGASPAA
jgi:hypothetical protein